MNYDDVSQQDTDISHFANIVLIEKNEFIRSCLSVALSQSCNIFAIEPHATIESWKRAGISATNAIVLLCSRDREPGHPNFLDDIDLIHTIAENASVIVVSDIEEPAAVVAALSKGARGYISHSSSLEVAVAAIRLVRAGGTFVPAGSLKASPEPARPVESTGEDTAFTDRQREVILRLRQGESNKVIAYNLGMGECTVKVHVRNIMKKIRARNRTEIAYLTNHMFESREINMLSRARAH